MGLVLRAACGACGFSRGGLRLGASMAQMSGERRSFVHLFACAACRDLAQVELALGEALDSPACDRCGRPLDASTRREVRIAGMKGNRLAGHACPRCGARALGFHEEGRFL